MNRRKLGNSNPHPTYEEEAAAREEEAFRKEIDPDDCGEAHGYIDEGGDHLNTETVIEAWRADTLVHGRSDGGPVMLVREKGKADRWLPFREP